MLAFHGEVVKVSLILIIPFISRYFQTEAGMKDYTGLYVEIHDYTIRLQI